MIVNIDPSNNFLLGMYKMFVNIVAETLSKYCQQHVASVRIACFLHASSSVSGKVL